MVVEAQQKSGDLYHVTSYWIENGKKIPKSWHGYMKGNRWHYIQDGFELASDGRRTMSYDPNTGDAQIWKDSSSESEFSSIFPSADLKWWKSDEAKGLRLEHNFLWNGQRFDKYVVTTHSQDWGATTNTLYVDPATNRPVYGEFLHSSGNGNALKWDYPNPQVESVLEIKLRPGTKVIDVTHERTRVR